MVNIMHISVKTCCKHIKGQEKQCLKHTVLVPVINNEENKLCYQHTNKFSIMYSVMYSVYYAQYGVK